MYILHYLIIVIQLFNQKEIHNTSASVELPVNN